MPDRCKVYYLFDDDHRRDLQTHVQDELSRVDREMCQVQQDLDLVGAAAEDLDQILLLLERMKALAVEVANNPQADKPRLQQQLSALKARIDAISWESRARWSARDAARIRGMVSALESFGL